MQLPYPVLKWACDPGQPISVICALWIVVGLGVGMSEFMTLIPIIPVGTGGKEKLPFHWDFQAWCCPTRKI